MAKGTPDPEYILRQGNSPVCAVCFSTDDNQKFLLSGNQDGQVNVWDLKTRQIRQALKAHEKSILGIIDIEGKVITHSRDNAVHIWTKQNGALEKSASIQCESSGFCKVSIISPAQGEQQIVVLPTESSQLDVISLQTQEKVGSLALPQGSHGMVMCTAVVNPSTVLSAYEDGSAALWHIPTLELLATSKWYTDPIMCIAFNHATNTGAAGSVNDQLKVFSITADDQKLTGIKDLPITNPGLNCVAFREDGKILAAGGWDGKVRLFSTKTYRLLAVLNFHADSVQTLSFAEDNSLAVGGKDGALSVWNVYK